MPSDKELLEVARTHAVIPDGHATILDRATVLRVLRAVALRFPADASESAALSPERVHEMWRAALAEGPEATTPMRFARAIERELRSTAGVAEPRHHTECRNTPMAEGADRDDPENATAAKPS